MNTRVLRSQREVVALLPEWTALFEADPRRTPRNAPHLTVGFHQMFAPGTVPRVIVVRTPTGTLAGVLALGLRYRRVGPLRLRQLGPLADWHAYYFDAVVDGAQSEAVCRALGAALVSLAWERLELRHLRADSWLLDPAGVLRGIEQARRTTGIPSHRIQLPREEVLGGRSGEDMRRREKLLHQTGTITSGWEGVGPAFRDTVREFIQLHTALKVQQRQTATFRYGSSATDFPAWLESEVAAGRARLFCFRRDGKLLAVSVVLCAGGETDSYRAAWDTDGAEFGLGILETTRLIEACAACGDRLFDLGPGTERYKAKWRPDVETLVDVDATRRSWRLLGVRTWLRLRGRTSPW